jgi:ABC-type transport system substrate-binding protein
MTADPTTFDPAVVQDVPTIDLMMQVFDGLVEWNTKNELAPAIAKSWDVSPDGKTYIFHLRDDVKFHNGRLVTSKDFKYTLERSLDPKLASPVAMVYLNDIVGAKDVADGKTNTLKGVETPDDHTLIIHIDTPKGYFLSKLTYPTAFVVAKEEIEKNGNKMTKDSFIGTGCFKLAEYVPNSKVVLEANKDYFEGKPILNRVERQIILDASTRHQMYERGDLDMVDVQMGDYERDKNDPVLSKELRYFDRAAVFYLTMNAQRFAPFKDKRVRQAFNYAVDKDTIIKVVLLNLNKKAAGPIPPGIPGFRSEFKGLELNVKKARELMAAAGYPEGKGFPTLTLYFREKQLELRHAGEILAEMYRKNLGINVSLQEMEWSTFLNARNNRSLPFYMLRWVADYIDPQDFTSVLFRSDSKQNAIEYTNPTVDKLCDAADVEQEQTKRMKLYQQAEDNIVDDAPWVPMWYQRDVELIKPYVTGLEDGLMGHLPPKRVRLEAK